MAIDIARRPLQIEDDFALLNLLIEKDFGNA